ncbi:MULTISPECIES: metalloregulator ArsR/SmtB family transcription factor [unclassified Virgibacillus]|uniref:ArsR/SmtB family transcription factor n=1 Tax=unclassified Virgibacillus TaxID=2620237 RepID=UPI0024DE2F97|nr:metalloregulator ArsR/SmtB family transcription factor [Virgibacillus sp. LDC-1]
MVTNHGNVTETAVLMKLLGDPTRLAIVSLLQSKTRCVCELVGGLEMSQPAISQHLRKLRDAKIVKEERRGQWKYYSLNPDYEQFLLLQKILTEVFIPLEISEKMDKAPSC